MADGFTDLEEKIMVVLVKERKTASQTIADAHEIAGMLNEENSKLQAEVERLNGPFTCGHEGKYKGGACAVCHVEWIDKAQSLKLQKGETEAERNRYKLALKLVVDAWGDDWDCFANPGHPDMAEKVRIARALLYGPEIDPALMEKRKGACTSNAVNPTLGHTLCLKELPCPDHGHHEYCDVNDQMIKGKPCNCGGR